MKYLFIGLAFISLAIGTLGIFLPILPTTPFLLISSFFFAKGSTRFHCWFTRTSLYKKHLVPYVQNRSMTLKTKLSILLPVTGMLLLVIITVENLHVRIAIGCLLVCKYVYFFAKIKTKKESSLKKEDQE